MYIRSPLFLLKENVTKFSIWLSRKQHIIWYLLTCLWCIKYIIKLWGILLVCWVLTMMLGYIQRRQNGIRVSNACCCSVIFCFMILLKLDISYINKTFQTVVKFIVYCLFFNFKRKLELKGHILFMYFLSMIKCMIVSLKVK